MRFLFVTDTQQRGNNPRCRRDDFPSTLLAKIAEVGALAQAYDVRAVLHGGDFWDIPLPTMPVVSRFLAAWRQALAGKDLYVVQGNHDQIGHNPNLVDRTALGLGAHLGLYHLLEHTPMFFEEPGLRVQVTGAPFHYEIDRRDPLLDYVPQVAEADRLLHIAHGMLVREPLFPGAPYTTLAAIWDRTPADLTLAGHNHLGFPLTERHGRLFYNPGALVRTSSDSRDAFRTVQALLIDVSAHGVDLTPLPLTSARPAADVIDMSAPADPAETERTERLRDFVDLVRQVGHRPGESVFAFLDRVADDRRVSPEVLALARALLSRVQERAQVRGEVVEA